MNKITALINPRLLIILMLLTSLLLTSCQQQEKTVTVGSKFFTEQKILAEIMAVYLEEKTDLKVKRKIPYGDTFDIFNALQNGEIDIYPEYTGTGLSLLYQQKKRQC